MKSKLLGIVKSSEIFVFVLTLLVIVGLTAVNYQISAARARNEERRENLDEIQAALIKFYKTYQFYPENSTDGKIVACKGPETVVRRGLILFDNPVPCEWGEDGLSEDPTDDGLVKLLDPIPPDPNALNGYSYFYLSTGQEFQIFASYEGKPELEYNEIIAKFSLPCGTKVCNSVKGSSGVSLEVPIKSVNNE